MNTLQFRKARYVTKETNLIDTIKRNLGFYLQLKKFKSNKSVKASSTETVKLMTKKRGTSQNNIDIARSRSIPLNEILTYHHLQNPLFDSDQVSKPSKTTGNLRNVPTRRHQS